MKIEYTIAISTLLIIWNRAKKIYDELAKIAEPIVKEIEKRAQDGKIDKADRKAIVMSAISAAEQSGKIKLNFLSRIIISKVVDRIAQKLPDFTISQEAANLIDSVPNVLDK